MAQLPVSGPSPVPRAQRPGPRAGPPGPGPGSRAPRPPRPGPGPRALVRGNRQQWAPWHGHHRSRKQQRREQPPAEGAMAQTPGAGRHGWPPLGYMWLRRRLSVECSIWTPEAVSDLGGRSYSTIRPLAHTVFIENIPKKGPTHTVCTRCRLHIHSITYAVTLRVRRAAMGITWVENIGIAPIRNALCN